MFAFNHLFKSATRTNQAMKINPFFTQYSLFAPTNLYETPFRGLRTSLRINRRLRKYRQEIIQKEQSFSKQAGKNSQGTLVNRFDSRQCSLFGVECEDGCFEN